MKQAFLAATIATFAFAPSAMAQTDKPQSEPRVDGIKGSPNANGFGKTDTGHTTDVETSNSMSSAKDMKGPPNANGFDKH